MSTSKTAPKPEAEKVVVSREGRRGRSGKLFAVAIVAVLVVIGTGLAVVYNQHRHDKQVAAEDLQSYNSDMKQYMALRDRQEFGSAISVLQAYVKDGLDTPRKAYALVNIATVYEEQQNNSQALKTYRQAEKLDVSQYRYIVDIGIARTAFATGDKATALQYYKAALPLMEQQRQQFSNDDINSLKQTISQVEAAQ